MGDRDNGIRIIITGGTFDKHYDELKGELTFNKSHLPEILKQVRCTIPITLEINQLKDSLDMVERDREVITNSCKCSIEKMIVITHGTDTMELTAKSLEEAGLGKTNTIVLTGAMIPYAVHGSDAVFNLGCSLGFVQQMPVGIYICMNGKIFAGSKVTKNREKGIFEPID